MRVVELSQHITGGSKYWVQCPTSDNGSDWFRLNAGTDSDTGILAIEINKDNLFNGSVVKL